MTAAEEQSWKWFRRIYGPFGEERADWRMANILKMIADVNKDPNSSVHFKITDFLLKFKSNTPEDDLDKLTKTVMKLAGY
ncbi:MAG: DUF4035 domain-containing protein [Planctomycetaceae bacterium]|nr:DUF4035 domain-containing protein [Planctomycetaceae bacterium]